MKRKYILMMLSVSMIMGRGRVFAQTTANAGVAANVILPVGLVKTVDMNFGNAAISAVTGGTIILAPTGTRTIGGSGVTLPATTGSVAAAAFTVSGAPGYTYAITLPASAVISGPGTATMTLNSFSSLPSGTGTLSSGGRQTLNVGATLSVAAAQASGTYTNATAIPVTVNYN